MSTQHHLLARQADALLSLGRVAYYQRAFEKSSSLLAEAWHLMDVCNYNLKRAPCRWWQAECAEMMGDRHKAIEFYMESKAWYEKFDQQDGAVACDKEIERLRAAIG